MDVEPAHFGLGCEFFDALTYRHIDVDEGACIEIDVTDDLRGPAGSVHGGIVATIIDVAGASCITRATSRPVATASAAIQYLSAGRIGPIRAMATVLRASDTLGVADVSVVDVGKDSRLMAAAHVTCRLLPGESFVRSTQ